MMKKILVNEWDKFWRLTIIKEDNKRGYVRYFKCRCICWNIKTIQLSHLRLWHTESCWCLAKERQSEQWKKSIKYMIKSLTKHWMTWTRFYRIYNNMKNRCEYKKYHEFRYYWWRWINCEWDNFIEFRDDMYSSYLCHSLEYWENNTTIDRIDVNWNYCKSNCRWATYRIQANNKRDVKNTK